jgi:hypothetical protein
MYAPSVCVVAVMQLSMSDNELFMLPGKMGSMDIPTGAVGVLPP